MKIGYSNNKEIRERSSSGGVVTSLLIGALENNLVDKIVVVDLDENFKPKYKLVSTKEEIIQAAGSKYSLMNMIELVRLIKSTKERLAIVCLPCHIRLLRRLENVKYIIGLFCGYNMPYEATEFLLKKLKIKKDDIIEMSYRGKNNGFSVITKTKEIHLPKYYYDFLNLMFVSEGCLKCKKFMNEEADISVGDCYENYTLITSRTSLGKELLNCADITTKSITEEEVFRLHKHNINHKKFGFSRSILKVFGRYFPVKFLGWLCGIRKRFKDELYYCKTKEWSYEDVGRFWDTVEEYDKFNEISAHNKRFSGTQDMIIIPENSKILDIDCRTGDGAVFFKDKIKRIICISPSENFLKICERRLKDNNINGKTLLLKEIPIYYEAGCFDIIFCFETLEHISNHNEFLNELNRLLKLKGKMLLTTPSKLWSIVHFLVAVFNIHHSEGYRRFLSKKEIRSLLNNNGFKILKEKTSVYLPFGLGLRRTFICEKEY